MVTKKVKLLNRYVLSYLYKMSGYIKYFENGGKNMSLMVKDVDLLGKYNEIGIRSKKV